MRLGARRAAINPTDASNIVAEYQQDRWSDGGARGLVASVTHNGGTTWARVVLPKLTRCAQGGNYDRASDPWLSFATNGDLYAISLSFDSSTAITRSSSRSPRTAVTRGVTPQELTADNTDGLDKESITADPRPNHANLVYAAWDRLISPGGSTHASDSTDGAGATWSTPIVISHTPAGVDAFVPTIAGKSSGTIGVTYYDFRNNTSTDGIAATDYWLVRCSGSCDNVSHWADETGVTATSFDMHQAPVARGEFLGDYEGMTTDGTTFQPFFIQAVSAGVESDGRVLRLRSVTTVLRRGRLD